VHVAVTGKKDADEGDMFEGEIKGRCCCGKDVPGKGCVCGSDGAEKRVSMSSGDIEDLITDEPASCCAPQAEASESQAEKPQDEKIEAEKSNGVTKPMSITASVNSLPMLNTTATNDVNFVAQRPHLAATIREAVETAEGETCVVVCGGKSLSGDVRNVVARLSDERAVHKGTGAQGIALWVEEFGF